MLKCLPNSFISLLLTYRKPKVTRKVTEDDAPKTVEIESSADAFDANSFDYIESMLGGSGPEKDDADAEEAPPQSNGQPEPMDTSSKDADSSSTSMTVTAAAPTAVTPTVAPTAAAAAEFVIPEGEW